MPVKLKLQEFLGICSFVAQISTKKVPPMPFIQAPPVSKQLQDEIHKAEKMHDFISGTVPDTFVGDTDQHMADEIEKKVNADGLFATIKPYINTLHGYTHGGMEQLGRRFNATGPAVQPNTATERSWRL